MQLEQIITTQKLHDSEGMYEFRNHGDGIEWDGKLHTYFSSGLCREVYVSPCRTYVLKIAINDRLIFTPEQLKQDPDLFRYLSPTIHHNYYEALCYQECPNDFRPYLAHTELLPGYVVKQEYVGVYHVKWSHELREIGVTSDGRIVIFDYDVLLDNFRKPECGFQYGKLPELIAILAQQLPT